MDCTGLLIFVFFGFGVTTCSDTRLYEFHYVNLSMNWNEAQRYCRENYTDLVTIESADDLTRLNRPGLGTLWSWIGLTDDPKSWKGVMGNDSNSWRWSATGTTSETDYQNWAYNEPTFTYAREKCVYIFNGKWLDDRCWIKKQFVCFNDTNPPGHRTYTFITNKVTWMDAQIYCRTHYTDLATIENARENEEVRSKISGQAWIGLYREPWRWSDKRSSYFRNWKHGHPNNNGGGKHCAAESPGHGWVDRDCNSKFSFWCRKDLRVKMTMVKMKIQTVADLSDPAVNDQILQQMCDKFKASGIDVKLRWVTRPRKEEEESDKSL